MESQKGIIDDIPFCLIGYYFEYQTNIIKFVDLPYNIQTPCPTINYIYPKYILNYNVNILNNVKIYF